ncbi:MAG: alpha-amylase family glycosyl hydrolase [Promethearchaeota archaeon]
MIELNDREGPRIYNLFPRLAGTIDTWGKHLERIKDMKFNWIYVNPLNYPGFSGSLYAIKDHYKFNPIFAPPGVQDPTSWAPLVDFIDECHSHGLRFMYDLVINHVSVDSDLIPLHPDWFLRKKAVVSKENGNVVRFYELDEVPPPDKYPADEYTIEVRISNPFAIDPANAEHVTIWGDLAEIDDEHSPDMENLIQYWKDLVKFYLELKIDGFRCDAAYQVPFTTWKQIITHAKSINPQSMFAAETLGCTLKQIEDVVKSGFDYIHNSSKWWDFSEPWCVSQYNEFRKHAPSIGFPENHDTQRLAKETGGNSEYQVFRYLFSAFFSAATMMLMGYEYGFQNKTDVVKGSPDDWEPATFDISSYIKHINTFKQKFKCLNEDGPIKDYHYGNPAILALKKSTRDNDQQLLLLYNKDWKESHDVPIDNLGYFLDLDTQVYQVNLFLKGIPIEGPTWKKKLGPNDFVFLLQDNTGLFS